VIALVEVKAGTDGDPRHEAPGFARWLAHLAEARLERFLEAFVRGRL
jgi:hypothetical protein